MFSGSVEEVGSVFKVAKKGNLSRLEVLSDSVAKAAKISDSIAVNGVCLTVAELEKSKLCFDVAASTLADTNIKLFKRRDPVNLETALKAGDKLGGHFVLGHIDLMLKVKRIINKKGYWEFEIDLPQKNKNNLVEKGSIALEGISLTVKKILLRSFTLDIIPFTYDNTNLKYKKTGQYLNAEFDYLLQRK